MPIQSHYPNILLIAGTGRNVGKTEFVCQCINYFSKQHKLVGLKVTNHFHEGEERTYSLKEEHNSESSKDTSRMLRAGASKVFYCQAEEAYLEKAFTVFLEQIDKDTIVICESGALRNLIQPGKFIVVRNTNLPIVKPKAQRFLNLADLIVTSDGKTFDIKVEDLNWP